MSRPILSTHSIVPGQTSYNSELVKAFAGHPQVVFASFDTQTAATMWSDANQLGYLSTPWIGDDLMATADYSKAFGPQAAITLFAAVPATPTGPAYQHFLADYQSANHSTAPLPATFNIYDAIVIASLAMTEAKSTDPKVWVNRVADVSSSPGTTCTDYASAGGSNDFNTHHNVFSGFSIDGFGTSHSGSQISYVTAADIAKLSS